MYCIARRIVVLILTQTITWASILNIPSYSGEMLVFQMEEVWQHRLGCSLQGRGLTMMTELMPGIVGQITGSNWYYIARLGQVAGVAGIVSKDRNGNME